MSTEVRDSLIDVGFVHIGTGNEGVSTLFGFPLRRIDEEIPDDHAYLRDVRQRKGIGHHFANQDTVVNVTAEILD